MGNDLRIGDWGAHTLKAIDQIVIKFLIADGTGL